jgi:hypothetical protein
VELAEEADVDVSILAGHRGHLTDEWNKVQKLRKKLDAAAVAKAAIRAPAAEPPD